MPKRKDYHAIVIPPIEVYARPTGKFQWTCPNCGQEHPMRPIPWRRMDTRCIRCFSRFRLGLGFDGIKGSEGYLMGKWDGYTGNRWQPKGTPFAGVRLFGDVEYSCPYCQHPQVSFLSHDARAECAHCGHPLYVSLLIYKGTNFKMRAPFDSLVKGLKHDARKAIKSPAAPAKADPSTGTPSDSSRGAS